MPLLRRQTACPAGKLHYVCAKGPFTGCCSTNPCNQGVCGDDDAGNGSANDKVQSSPIVSNTANVATNPTPVKTPAPTEVTPATAAVNPSPATNAAPATNTAATPVQSPGATEMSTLSATSTSQLTAGASRTAPATKTTSTSPSPTPDNGKHIPVGPIVGGILGGLALLALLALLLRCCLKRKMKLRVKIKNEKKQKEQDDEDEEERFKKLQTHILDREKFLDAARQRSNNVESSRAPFKEFGGILHKSRSRKAKIPSRRSSSQRLTISSPIPTATTVAKTNSCLHKIPNPPPKMPYQKDKPLPLITEKDSSTTIPLLDGNQLENPKSPVKQDPTIAQLPAELSSTTTSLSSMPRQPATKLGPSRPPPPWQPPRSSYSRATPPNFSSLISPTSKPLSTPISIASSRSTTLCSSQRHDSILGPDGIVMRSNLNLAGCHVPPNSNGTGTGKQPRPGSIPKHVLSFMEFDSENDANSLSDAASGTLGGSRQDSLTASVSQGYLPSIPQGSARGLGGRSVW